ncbi:MAG: bifunctional metallophosphatase/5'-nucleotidase [Firmicutes bacterium]|nr:bifunctional metallophosphatase/5'-nucleotidase [Bacillota bacterium]
MKKRNKILAAALALCLVFTMIPGLSFAAETAAAKDIVVLYSSDINGSVDTNIGVAGMAAYANAMRAEGKYVEIVDTGNAVGGSVLASISKGAYVVEAMNAGGYGIAVPGAKEFAYGVDVLVSDIMLEADYNYLSCNFTIAGTDNSIFSPYKIVKYGDTDIAYVGISDPDIINQVPYMKLSDGTALYSFAEGNNGADLYAKVQAAVDAAKAEGADYIIALGNLRNTADKAFTAESVLQNTSGINAFINSNSGKSVSGTTVKTKDGAYALLTSPGAGISNIGVMTISAGKTISSQLITSYTLRDIKTKDAVDKLTEEYSAGLKEAFATTSSRLEAASTSGDRIIESTETNLGDLVADAYRSVTGADVALVEASELKTNIAVGGISYNDIIRAVPGGQNISVAQVSGFDLLDALEMSARLYPNANKGFLQVSGVTFDIQETVIPSVSVDGLGDFISVDDDYRVTNVMINGKALDLLGTYTVAGTNKLLNGETGYTMLTNGPLAKVNVATDSQAVISYIKDVLKGSVGGAYSKSQIRIDSIKLARQSEIDAMVEKQADKKLKEYKEKLEELQKEIEIQEEVIAIKTMTIKASSKFTKTSGKRKITVTWTASEDVDGIKYQVYKSSKKSSGYSKMLTTSKKTYSNTSGLTKGKTYYYKVRAYKYLNGKYYYSDWSNIASRKVSK